MTPQAEMWVGLVELKPLDSKSYGACGAFTNIVTWAVCQSSFRQKVEEIASYLDMQVAGIEDAEPVWERASRSTLTETVKEMISRAQSNKNAIIYGTFHRDPSDTG